MENTKVFKRYDLKYIIDREQKEAVMQEVLKRMNSDPHGESTVRNIYFDTTITVKNSENEEILSYTPLKSYGSIVISHPEIKKGEKYIVTVGNTDYEIEMNDIIYGSSNGGMGGPGGMGGFGGMGGQCGGMRPGF